MVPILLPFSYMSSSSPPWFSPQPTKPAKPESTEPAPGSTDDSGKVYVPGFGYVEDSGENHGGELNDMYENGNKIGTMG